MREGSGGERIVEHEYSMPEGVKEGLEEALAQEDDEETVQQKAANGEDASGPFTSRRLGILNSKSIRHKSYIVLRTPTHPQHPYPPQEKQN